MKHNQSSWSMVPDPESRSMTHEFSRILTPKLIRQWNNTSNAARRLRLLGDRGLMTTCFCARRLSCSSKEYETRSYYSSIQFQLQQDRAVDSTETTVHTIPSSSRNLSLIATFATFHRRRQALPQPVPRQTDKALVYESWMTSPSEMCIKGGGRGAEKVS